jgi:hypothetical protein
LWNDCSVRFLWENPELTMMSAPEHCHGGASIALPSMIGAFSSLPILGNVLRLPSKTPY